ncbi:hypothetical protein [Vibrio phage vB_VhaP_PG11]|nr:hypothetical protein [Vibrio phage vB_VhaP_PG11]
MFLTMPFNPVFVVVIFILAILVLVFGYKGWKYLKNGMAKAFEELDKEKRER